jgi:phosphonate transport system substrate-binding protein
MNVMPRYGLRLMYTILNCVALCSLVHAGEGPRHYSFGVVPQFEQRKLYAIWKPIVEELEKQTGLKLKLTTTLQIQDFEKEYLQGNYDFVYMNPYFMVKGIQAKNYIPLVHDKTPLRGILVVRKDGPIKKIADLKGKTMAFPSPNAIGACLMIRSDLERLYQVTVTPLYVKTHSSVYLHVARDRVPAGGGVQKTLQEQDPLIQESLMVLYTTRPIPSHPIAAHERVPKADRERLQKALFAMGNTEAGRALLSRIPVQALETATTEEYAVMEGWGLDRYWDPSWRED